VVIFGSGARCVRAARAAARLIERRIGVETMDTAAACRTYNVLVSEGRSVVAACCWQAAAGGRLLRGPRGVRGPADEDFIIR
jgi:hypothetical protein